MLGSLTQRECEEFLADKWFGHLGCHAEAQTFVVPISFVFRSGHLIGQTKAGRKIDMMKVNPQVCVGVDSVEGPADWKSVILWGRFEELKGFDAVDAMGHLIDHLCDKVPHYRSPRDVTPGRTDGQPQVSIVYRINVEQMTGRFETSC